MPAACMRSGRYRPRTPRPPQPTTPRTIMSPVCSSQWDTTPPTMASYAGYPDGVRLARELRECAGLERRIERIERREDHQTVPDVRRLVAGRMQPRLRLLRPEEVRSCRVDGRIERRYDRDPALRHVREHLRQGGQRVRAGRHAHTLAALGPIGQLELVVLGLEAIGRHVGRRRQRLIPTAHCSFQEVQCDGLLPRSGMGAGWLAGIVPRT